MRGTTLIGLGAAATLAVSSPTGSIASKRATPMLNTAGFLDPQITYSQGKHAICVAGTIPVQASTNANVQIDLPSNLTADQTTQIVLSLDSADAPAFLKSTLRANSTVGGTWNISSRLCFPVNATAKSPQPSQVQLLTHGIGFDQFYWDFSVPCNDTTAYSYVDYAAQQGQITFTYDRLGVANSSHPDPIQAVQGPLEVEILHSLTTALRSGHISNTSFDSIIGVGHSYGSQLTGALTAKYPTDFDAIVLTGFSNNKTGGPSFTSALNLLSAPNMSSGYLIPTTLYGVRYAFFSYPDYVKGVPEAAFKTIQTTTIGEQMTQARISTPSLNYTRPVYILDGEHDLVFCDGDCTSIVAKGLDIPAATLAQRFPAADRNKSTTSILGGAGHGVNLATNATVAFGMVQKWIAAL